MAYIDQRRPECFAEGGDDIPEPGRLFVIEALAGLIEDEHGWILDEGPGQKDHALLSRGQLREATVSKGLEG